jgi:hypothetical protein
MKIFQIYYSYITFYKPKRMDLYWIWQEEIGKKSWVKNQHVQNVGLSDITVEKLSEEELILDTLYRFSSKIETVEK